MEGRSFQRRADCISTRLLDALASAADTDPLALNVPLYDVVDVEALARLVGSDGLDAVTFEYDGHEVVVRGDGSVTVDDTN